jgi:hypothetical protein
MPQRGRNDLGFADFRLDTLSQRLNADTIVRALQKAAPPEIHVKANKRWCTLHFPLIQANEVAELFDRHIISKVK